MAKKKAKRKKSMTCRFFFKTVVQIEILSENPFEFISLTDLDCLISKGLVAGDVQIIEQDELTGKEAAAALIQQGTDPGFFNLTADGEDADGTG
jgi:hypothetical protein